MARTKRQAIARRAETTQAATAVNDEEGDRVESANEGGKGSDGASMVSSSISARREETGEEAAVEQAMQGTDSQQITDGRTTGQQGGISGNQQITQEVEDSFYTARDTLQEQTTATTARRGRAMSESPSVASPLKTGQHRSRGQTGTNRPQGAMRRLNTSAGEARQCNIGADTGRMRTGGRTAVSIRNDERQAADDRGPASAEEGMGTDEETTITGATAKTRRKTRTARGRMTYLQQVRPVFEKLLGQLELALLGGLEDVTDIRTESEWRTVECPALVRLFVNKQRGFARFLLEATSHEEAVGCLMTLQWAWDRRKTRPETEDRSIQEAGQRVFNALQNALGDRLDDSGWRKAAEEFGDAVKPLCGLLDALETEVNVENYPRVMYEAGREKETETRRMEEESDQQEMGHQPHQEAGQRPSRRRGEEDATTARERQGRQAAEGDREEVGEGEDGRLYPESPRARRTNPDARGYGGWDAIDSLTVDQCARMPMGMQTVEFIPNSLQDEWTGAWNTVYRMREEALTDEERDRALKWILWLPQGLLHASSRGGKKGARQYREMARRFVAWRKRDMQALLKIWRLAAVTAEKRMTKAKARKVKGDNARIERAVRLMRKGAISRAGKALESKGLGDMDDIEIWNQIDDKHPARKRRITEQAYAFQPEEELQLKLEKILPKLDVHAAPGPSGLRNGHLRIWAGVFAPEAAEEAVEHLEHLISDMANDKMPAWFMRATQDAEVIALVKREAEEQERTADHRPVQVPNTISKLEDKAVLAQYQEVYIKEMMPQQLGVGVKFAAELLVMGLRMTLYRSPDFIIVGVDISNAFCEIMRASVIDRHMQHEILCGMVPYWRAKLGPVAKLWAGKDSMEY